jgi:hypothetical protein
MSITVQGPGGSSIEFPDGTDAATIDKVMRQATGAKPSAAPAAGPEPGLAEAIGRGAAAGATFNFYDELAGLSKASGDRGADQPMSLGQLVKGAYKKLTGDPEAEQRYQAEVDTQRKAQEAAQQAHPAGYLGGEVLGSIPSVVAGGAAGSALRATGVPGSGAAAALLSGAPAEGAGAVARGAALVGSGAGYGALAGAGAAKEGERAAGAGSGALTGAIAAPLVAGAGAVLGNVAGHIGATISPARRAAGAVREAVESDSGNVGDIASQMAGAQARGQPATMADLAGPNVRGLASSLTRAPGATKTEAQRFLEDRQLGADPASIGSNAPPPGGVSSPGSSQGERINDALTGLTGGSTRGTLATADDIVTQRAADAAPLYEAAHAAQIPNDAIPVHLLDRLQRAGVFDEAVQKMGVRGEPFDIGTVQPWDVMKEALGDRIGAAQRAGQNSAARDFTRLKNDLTGAIDAAVPVYAQARQVFAGHSELNDALEAGAKAFAPSVPREALQREYAALGTDGERQMYRLGFVNPEGGDKAKLLMGNRAIREKISAIAPDTASREDFFGRLGTESQMFRTAATLGNSATAGRLAEDAQVGRHIAEAPHVIGSLVTGNFHPLIGLAARQMARVDPNTRQRVLQNIHDLVLNPDPARVQAFADQITQSQMAEGTRQRVIAGVRTMLRALPRAVTTGSQIVPETQ